MRAFIYEVTEEADSSTEPRLRLLNLAILARLQRERDGSIPPPPPRDPRSGRRVQRTQSVKAAPEYKGTIVPIYYSSSTLQNLNFPVLIPPPTLQSFSQPPPNYPPPPPCGTIYEEMDDDDDGYMRTNGDRARIRNYKRARRASKIEGEAAAKEPEYLKLSEINPKVSNV